MIAKVSNAARDRRIFRLPRSIRATHSCCSAVVVTIQPPAISRSSTPDSRALYSAPSASSASLTRSAGVSSASASRASVSGWSDENSSASTAERRCTGGIGAHPFLEAWQDQDVGEVRLLDTGDGAELDQLEQRHERDDDLHAHARAAHDVGEAHLAVLGHGARQQRHHLLDVEALGLDRVDGLLFSTRHDALERLEQVEQRRRGQGQRARVVLGGRVAALVQRAALRFVLSEADRRLLVEAVLEQALHQLLAWVAFLLVLG